MKYRLIDEFGSPAKEGVTVDLNIQHEDGTNLLMSCGCCKSPFTEDRAKLDEMIRLANIAASDEGDFLSW